MAESFEYFECGTCGSSVLVVKSIAGQPWEVSCENGHPWVRTGDDVTFIAPFDAEVHRV